jgi:hypothetical protein
MDANTEHEDCHGITLREAVKVACSSGRPTTKRQAMRSQLLNEEMHAGIQVAETLICDAVVELIRHYRMEALEHDDLPPEIVVPIPCAVFKQDHFVGWFWQGSDYVLMTPKERKRDLSAQRAATQGYLSPHRVKNFAKALVSGIGTVGGCAPEGIRVAHAERMLKAQTELRGLKQAASAVHAVRRKMSRVDSMATVVESALSRYAFVPSDEIDL